SMNIYNYKPQTLDYNINSIYSSSENSINRFSITFPSVYSTDIKENDRVYSELFINNSQSERKGEIDNILIFVHGFGTKKKKLSNYYYFASSLADRGIPCILLNLPFHLKRKPPGEVSGGRIVYFDDIQTLDFFHQSVVDIRRLAEIISDIYNPGNIDICGISMGSMISVIAAALEDKIRRCVLLIGGGNWEEVHWNGALKYILKGDCSDKNISNRQECMETYKEFPGFLKQLKSSNNKVLTDNFENISELRKVIPKACFLCDPLAFSHMMDPSKVLMINSRFDLYFSRKSTKYLWEELGKPEIKWLNKFHSSTILKNEKVLKMIQNFLVKKD
ncbi:alpha/beta hydrolase, partial [Actinomycetota bacterium]